MTWLFLLKIIMLKCFLEVINMPAIAAATPTHSVLLYACDFNSQSDAAA